MLLALCLGAPTIAGAATDRTVDDNTSGNTSQGVRLSTGGMSLGRGTVDLMNNHFGACRWLDNTSTNDYFVPDADAEGWNSFIAHAPAGVIRDRCCLSASVTLTSSDGRTATDTLINGRNRSTHTNYRDTAVATFPMSRQDCTTHCDGSTTCNTTSWTETVSQTYTCEATGWNSATVTRSAAPAVNAPAYQSCPLTSGPWTTGPWSVCSATTCGTSGVQTRTVTCDYDSCTGPTPPTTQSCSAAPCGWTYSWKTDGWSACSATCGGGTRERAVICKRNDGTIVADANCPNPKPATVEACNTQACSTSGPWTVGPWGACSATCGGGTQTRSVSCDYDDCPDMMPVALQDCNTQACQPVCHYVVTSMSGGNCGANAQNRANQMANTVCEPSDGTLMEDYAGCIIAAECSCAAPPPPPPAYDCAAATPVPHCDDGSLPNASQGQTAAVTCGTQCNKSRPYICDAGVWVPTDVCGGNRGGW
ncbi:MAG: thrombospondin type-1 domain-containing protein [Gammaproteobacteria bacterium]